MMYRGFMVPEFTNVVRYFNVQELTKDIYTVSRLILAVDAMGVNTPVKEDALDFLHRIQFSLTKASLEVQKPADNQYDLNGMEVERHAGF